MGDDGGDHGQQPYSRRNDIKKSGRSSFPPVCAKRAANRPEPAYFIVCPRKNELIALIPAWIEGQQ